MIVGRTSHGRNPSHVALQVVLPAPVLLSLDRVESFRTTLPVFRHTVERSLHMRDCPSRGERRISEKIRNGSSCCAESFRKCYWATIWAVWDGHT